MSCPICRGGFGPARMDDVCEECFDKPKYDIQISESGGEFPFKDFEAWFATICARPGPFNLGEEGFVWAEQGARWMFDRMRGGKK